jgi:hypothetical protein
MNIPSFYEYAGRRVSVQPMPRSPAPGFVESARPLATDEGRELIEVAWVKWQEERAAIP